MASIQRMMIVILCGLLVGALCSCRGVLSQQSVFERGKPFCFALEEGNGLVFQFRPDGTYSIDREVLFHSDKGYIREDKGTWRRITTNRLKMTSEYLLYPPILEYASLKVTILTCQSIRSIIPALDELLASSVKQDFEWEAFLQTLKAIPPLKKEEDEDEDFAYGTRGEIEALAPVFLRRDCERFHCDLKRLIANPVWWEVSCDLVKDGESVKLVPEKRKREAFRTYYPFPLEAAITNTLHDSPRNFPRLAIP